MIQVADSLLQRIWGPSTAPTVGKNREIEYEYLPDGFAHAARDPKIKGWNVETIVNVYHWNWEMFGQLVDGKGPPGYSPECGLPVKDDVSFQNTILVFAYSLALCSRNSNSMKLLDWGGGMGHYYKIAKALVPEVHIDYHCKDLELLTKAGRQVNPEGQFYADDTCLDQIYDFILVSSSLQYNQDWKPLIHKLAHSLSGNILITRLPITTESQSYVFVQRPYKYGYDTEYIGWCINQDEFLQCCTEAGLELVREFVIAENTDILNAPGSCKYKAFLLTNKTKSNRQEPARKSATASVPTSTNASTLAASSAHLTGSSPFKQGDIESRKTDPELIKGSKHFCTLFDKNYLLRGLALYQSLMQHCKDFTLWILCLDEQTHDLLKKMQLAQIKLIRLSEFEGVNSDLLAVKSGRSTLEYYFTCTPVLIKHVIQEIGTRAAVTYLDADLFFYSDPQPVFDELAYGSTLIIASNFPEQLKKCEIYGKYNVGLLTFINDDAGLSCLEWWRQSCLEWCFDQLEYQRYADQKYLDQFQSRFSRVVVSEQAGAGLAPWNWTSCSVDKASNKIVIGEQPLIFFHFHKFKVLNSWACDPCTLGDEYGMPSVAARKLLCQPYIKSLKSCYELVKLVDNSFKFADEMQEPEKNLLGIIKNILTGRYLFSKV